jgi:hypothetical protein
MYAVTALLFTFMIFSVAIIAQDALLDDGDDDGSRAHVGEGKVRLEAHIMSKCPDARDCLRDLILPVMQREEVRGRVDVRLSYIGRYVVVVAPFLLFLLFISLQFPLISRCRIRSQMVAGQTFKIKSLHLEPPSPLSCFPQMSKELTLFPHFHSITPHNDGVECMHGESECLGNIIELCSAKLHRDPKIHLGFTMCLSRDYAAIPSRDLIEDCALEHGISMAKLNQCATEDDGVHGVEMLQRSFNRSAKAGVRTSCTIRLDDEVRCVRDGGEWKDCEGGSGVDDLVRDILGEVGRREEREGWSAA